MLFFFLNREVDFELFFLPSPPPRFFSLALFLHEGSGDDQFPHVPLEDYDAWSSSLFLPPRASPPSRMTEASSEGFKRCLDRLLISTP